jgi:hypothetical protein
MVAEPFITFFKKNLMDIAYSITESCLAIQKPFVINDSSIGLFIYIVPSTMDYGKAWVGMN